MQTGLVKYEPQLKITTFSKKEYLFPASKSQELDFALENSKFLSIGPARINVSSIDTIDPVGKEENFFKQMTKGLSLDVVKKIESKIKIRKSKTVEPLTEGILQIMIDQCSKK